MAALSCLCLATAAWAGEAPLALKQRLVYQVQGGDLPAVNRAVGRIRHLGQPEDLMRELAVMTSWGSLRARRNATHLFTALPDRRFASFLVPALRDADATVRANACIALGRMRAEEAAKPISHLSTDRAPFVRREAFTALGAIGSADGFPAALAGVEDPEVEPRLAAVLALGAIGDRRAVPKLLPLLQHRSEAHRLAAARSLCRLGAPGGRKLADKLLSSEQPTERREGIILISEVSAAWASQALAKGLSDTNLEVRIASARGLAGQQDRRGVESLVRAAQTAPPEERLSIERALEELRVGPEERRRILKNLPAEKGLP